MFDRTAMIFQGGGERVVPYEKTVIEKRAPTDESIKIYDEMVEKAQASLVGRITSNTPIDMEVCVFRDVSRQNYNVHYVCNINGKEIQNKIVIPKIQIQNMDDKFDIGKILARIYERVLAELVSDCMRDVQYEFSRYGGL